MNKKKHIKGIKNILITIIVILGLLVICNSSKAANIVTYDFDSKIPSFMWKLNCGINNNQGIDNSKCLMLKSENYEDAYAMISVEGLDENKKYCIEAYIKTSNIEKENDEEEKTGAFLNIYIGNETSNIEYITGTNGYKKVKINAYPVNGQICIMSNIEKAKGVAYIDNISVKESTDESIDFISSNKKIILRANTKTIEAIGSEKRLQTLVDNIGTAYYDINELTGTLPVSYRDNDAVLIDVTGEDLDWCLAYAAYASGFIHCDANGFNEEMQKLKYRYENNLGEDWNFMILHELGHLFQGNVAWNFESEMMTDLQAAYVLEKNNVGAAPAEFEAEELFIGEQIKEAYKRSGKQLGKGSLEYGYDMYGAAAKFLDIKENIGWESFKKVYHELNKKYGTNSNLSKYEKFYEFVNALTIAYGEDIQSYFNTEEWYSIVKYCGGYCESSEEKVQINNKENLKLKVGQNYKLEAILSTGEKTDIDWTSSDIEVATINSKGEITAKKRGTVVITAMSRKTGEFDTCTIIINEELKRIRLAKRPEKITYIEGEAFNKKGMQIVAIYKDGVEKIVTDYTIIGGEKLELNQTNVIISYTEAGITKTTVQPITVKAKEVDIRELENIEITNSPNKKEYIEGESFNRAGMTIIANYKDGTYREITNYRIKDGEKVEIGQESVTIEYTEGEITKEIKQNIIVRTKEIIGSWEISETAQDRVIATLYNNGVLSIQGTGKMKDYKDVNPPWDANKNDIKRIEIENGVEKIGERAFIYCSDLTNVTIPSSVKSIGYGAFGYCTNLTEVEIENGVEEIGEYAFAYCISLREITIPGSVKSIGGAAFNNCTSLTEVEIESGVEGIEEYAFQYCSNLTKVTIPGSVKTIGKVAFGDCTSLTEVEIESGVEEIGEYAFAYCSSLTKVTIPESIKSMGYGAFGQCASLTEVEIESGVEEIGGYAFYNCNSLEKAIIPGSVKSIGNSAFVYCTSLTEVEIESGVEEIGEHAFQYCSKLTKVTIPGSVKSIGNSAFSDCTSLTEVEIESGVEEIGEYAFQYCSKLTKVTIPGSVKSIGYAAFSDCTSLTEVEIESGVEEIGEHAFQYCSNLTKITIPGSVKSIGEVAFGDCTSLTKVTIPGSVKSIEYAAFYECTGLTEVEIESGVEAIGGYAFYNCNSLEKAIIPGSVKSIGEAAFGNCTNLSKIEIASAITNIDSVAFYGCNNLTIYCNQDSHAEEYAKTNNIKYINKDVDSYLNNIKITSLPSKIEYVETENFDKTGMEVTATYNDGSKKVVTNYEIKDKENLKIGQESITIEYTEGEITKTAIQRIKVIEKELEIEVKEESVYEIKQDGEDIYLENIKLEETIETVLGNIETNGEIKIYKGTTEVTDKNTKVATGMIIKITLKNETKEYKTVVTGDLNGDGQMNDIDVLMLGRYKAKLYEGLKGEYLRASDIVKNGEYAEDVDLLKMARILVGLGVY